MTILDRVRCTFSKCQIGEKFTRAEIVKKVKTTFPYDNFSISSVVPPDYCYNRVNDGLFNNPKLLDFNIFEYEGFDSFKYLGENYPYEGVILQNPTDTNIEIEVGKWINGKRVLYDLK